MPPIRDPKTRRGKRWNATEVEKLVAALRKAERTHMIVRTNGGQHVQVLSNYDRDIDKTLFRARMCDSYGRSQSEFTGWYESFDEAAREAKKMEKK